MRDYNRAHPAHPLRCVCAGFAAPARAKRLGGKPISITDTPKGSTQSLTGTLGRWWTAPYEAAWSSFQHVLAARYDNGPLIHSVAVTSCSTVDGEPFIVPKGVALAAIPERYDASRPARLPEPRTGGLLRLAAHRAGVRLRRLPGVHEHRPTDRPIPFEVSLMKHCQALQRQTGRVCALANHALEVPMGGQAPTYAAIDAIFRSHPHDTQVTPRMGPPKNFGGRAAIDYAIARHPRGVAVLRHGPTPHGFAGFTAYPERELALRDLALRSGRRSPAADPPRTQIAWG